MLRKLFALFAAVVVFSTASVAFDGNVEVTNSTGYDIYFLYISPGKAETWEEDGDTYTLWDVDIAARDVTFTLSDLD